MASTFRIVLYQAVVALVVAASLALVSLDQGLAALLAGLVCIAPNAYFAWRASVERSPARLLAHGVGKLVVTTALMAALFATVKPAALGFFAAFIAMQLMYVVGSLGSAARPPDGARQGRGTAGTGQTSDHTTVKRVGAGRTVRNPVSR